MGNYWDVPLLHLVCDISVVWNINKTITVITLKNCSTIIQCQITFEIPVLFINFDVLIAEIYTKQPTLYNVTSASHDITYCLLIAHAKFVSTVPQTYH